MKVIIISSENHLISVDSAIFFSSNLLRFIINQLRNKNFSFILITLNLIEKNILLKLLEFCKYKYFKWNQNKENFLAYTDLMQNGVINYGAPNMSISSCIVNYIPLDEIDVRHWYKSFLDMTFKLKIDLVKLAHLLDIPELLTLLYYGIVVEFLVKTDSYTNL